MIRKFDSIFWSDPWFVKIGVKLKISCPKNTNQVTEFGPNFETVVDYLISDHGPGQNFKSVHQFGMVQLSGPVGVFLLFRSFCINFNTKFYDEFYPNFTV